MALPDFGRSVNPISTRGANYAHHIITAPTPLDFRRPYGPDIICYSPVCRGQVDRRQLASWFNPVPPRLCHVIYCHVYKKYSFLRGIGLNGRNFARNKFGNTFLVQRWLQSEYREGHIERLFFIED